jgi:hypothetical protein
LPPTVSKYDKYKVQNTIEAAGKRMGVRFVPLTKWLEVLVPAKNFLKIQQSSSWKKLFKNKVYLYFNFQISKTSSIRRRAFISNDEL